ncbi:hypothetical protein HAX54_039502, partial [Datura stramonium]|nr:hypothetical protein [Datura stramonium]
MGVSTELLLRSEYRNRLFRMLHRQCQLLYHCCLTYRCSDEIVECVIGMPNHGGLPVPQNTLRAQTQ